MHKEDIIHVPVHALTQCKLPHNNIFILTHIIITYREVHFCTHEPKCSKAIIIIDINRNIVTVSLNVT